MSVGALYEAIDAEPAYFGKPTVATRVENLSDLSFPDESFDFVIGNQTMEHWAENGCRLKWGLYQCFRVCRPGGYVFMNVPIHFHGAREFMKGDLARLQRTLGKFSTEVRVEAWGYPSYPLRPVFPFPGYRALSDKPAYTVDIRARKDKPLPNRCRRGFAASGLMGRVLTRPPSFLIYRLKQRLVGTRD